MCIALRGKLFSKRINNETRIHLNLETTEISNPAIKKMLKINNKTTITKLTIKTVVR